MLTLLATASRVCCQRCTSYLCDERARNGKRVLDAPPVFKEGHRQLVAIAGNCKQYMIASRVDHKPELGQ